MKKWYFIFVILAILIGIVTARADDIDTQIALKEVQFQSLQWEFRFMQERITTIQKEAQGLQMEINDLKKRQQEKKKESEKKEVK